MFSGKRVRLFGKTISYYARMSLRFTIYVQDSSSNQKSSLKDVLTSFEGAFSMRTNGFLRKLEEGKK